MGGSWLGARPGGKELPGKNHEAASVSWTGRANPPSLSGEVFPPDRGDHAKRVTGTPSARRILRKPVEASRRRASPADAFCPEAPCPRLTTEALRTEQSSYRRNFRQSRGFTITKSSAVRLMRIPTLRPTYIFSYSRDIFSGVRIFLKSGPRALIRSRSSM